MYKERFELWVYTLKEYLNTRCRNVILEESKKDNEKNKWTGTSRSERKETDCPNRKFLKNKFNNELKYFQKKNILRYILFKNNKEHCRKPPCVHAQIEFGNRQNGFQTYKIGGLKSFDEERAVAYFKYKTYGFFFTAANIKVLKCHL